MRNIVLFFFLIQGSVAFTDWEDTNSTVLIPDPVIVAIEKAADTIKRDLAAELRAMFEELPNVILQPPARWVQATPPPGRVVDVKEGQQLVFAADEADADHTGPAYLGSSSTGSASTSSSSTSSSSTSSSSTSPPSPRPARPPQRPRLPAVPPADLYIPPRSAAPPSPASEPGEPASP